MLAHSPSVDDGAAATRNAKSPRARKSSLYCMAGEVPRARGLKYWYYAPRNFREWDCDLGKKDEFSLPIYRLSQRITSICWKIQLCFTERVSSRIFVIDLARWAHTYPPWYLRFGCWAVSAAIFPIRLQRVTEIVARELPENPAQLKHHYCWLIWHQWRQMNQPKARWFEHEGVVQPKVMGKWFTRYVLR